MNQPEHVAIIMDGNGRWAEVQNRPRTYGHLYGAKTARNLITAAADRKVKYLTLFTFSSENWLRPEKEVRFLMRLLRHQILRERRTLMENDIQFRVIGDIDRLPTPARKVILDTVELTRQNKGMRLIFALSYGGRQEITAAARSLAEKVLNGELRLDEIDEATFQNQLASHTIPDPDLIIRTSGEQRLSNFFLWQSAYSEIYVVKKHWPDFTATDLDEALQHFSRRERRFGRVAPLLEISR